MLWCTKSGLESDTSAGFTLYDSNNNAVGSEKTTASTGSDVYIAWDNIPYGTGYRIVETTVPAGYNKMADITGINITSNGQVIRVNGTNTKMTDSIVLTKSGLEAGATAGFTLYDSNNNAVGSEKQVTGTGSDVTVTWDNVPVGSGYYIRETTVPAGYNKMADITGIDITTNGQVVKVSGNNTKEIPLTIKHLGSITGSGDPNYLYGAARVFVSGNYAYVTSANDNALSIFDISDPANPVHKGSITGAGAPNYLYGAESVYVSGNYAYVASYADNALSIFDISDPANPVHKGSITGVGAPNYLYGAMNVFVKGNYAYVIGHYDNALSIFDISDPANPVHKGSITGAGAPNYLGRAYNLYVSGNYAYVASIGDNALSIFDISDPVNPVHVGAITGAGVPNYLGGAYSVYINGNYAYVAGFHDNALSIFDISDPVNPVHKGSITGCGAPNYLSGAHCVCINGNYAYVASHYDSALSIFDISDPANPVHVDAITGSGAPNYLGGAASVYVSGNYVYAASALDNALSIFEFPSSAAITGSIVLTKSGLEAGAVAGFTLYDSNNQPIGVAYDSGGNAVEYEKLVAGTGQDITITWENVPYGSDYKIEETTVPNGYNKIPDITGIDLTTNGQVIRVSGNNTKVSGLGSITLTKSGLEAGAVAGFTLYDSNNQPIGVAYDSGGNAIEYEKLITGTGSDIYITWDNVPAATGYKIVETTVPTGYSKMDDITGIDITSQDQIVSVNGTNTKTPGSITVNITGLLGNDTATFTLSGGPTESTTTTDGTTTTENTTIITLDNNVGDSAYTSTYTWTDLPYGTYILTETYGSGNIYIYTTDLSPNPKTVVVNEITPNITLDVVNSPQLGTINLIKYVDNGIPPDSSIFTIHWSATDGNSGDIILNSANGWALNSFELLGGISYTFTEEASSGFGFVNLEGNDGNYYTSPSFTLTAQTGANGSIAFYNETISGQITLTKSGLEAGAIAGFTLYDSNNDAIGSEKQVSGTGSDVTITWDNVLAGTGYYIIETTIPNGYNQMADISGIDITTQDQVVNVTEENTKIENLLTIKYSGYITGSGYPNYLSGAHSVYVNGKYAYVVSHYDNSLSVFDISDPEHPVLAAEPIVGSGPPNYLGGAASVFVKGNYAYVASPLDDALSIFDISDPENPVHKSFLANGINPDYHLGGAASVFVSGNYAYVASNTDNALAIFDITDPTHPVYAGRIEGSGYPNYLGGAEGVFVSGNYAYVTSMGDDALSIFDISDPEHPVLAGEPVRGEGHPNYLYAAHNVFVQGNYAYVTGTYDNALSIFDISDPAHPVFKGKIRGKGSPNYLCAAFNLYVSGKYAYVASTYDNALSIFDISDPEHPVLAAEPIFGSGPPNYLGGAISVFVQGNYIYMAGLFDNALSIFEFPTSKKITGSITLTKSGLEAGAIAGFTLYDSNNDAIGSEKQVSGTGSDVTITWDNVLAGTGYKIVETTVPSDYNKMDDITGISITEQGQVVNVTAVNILAIPTIDNVLPNPTTAGSEVTITGSNFGNIDLDSFITFIEGIQVNSSDATSWTDDQIKLNVPTGALTGNLTVTTPIGTSEGYFVNIVLGYKTVTIQSGTQNVDATEEAGVTAEISSDNGATVTLMNLNPASIDNQGMTIEGADEYVDLKLDSSSGVNEIVFTILNAVGIAKWWNGSEWIECSNYTNDGINTVITINNNTIPSLNQLTGTEFTVVSYPTELVINFPSSIKYSDKLEGTATLTSKSTPIQGKGIIFNSIISPPIMDITDINGLSEVSYIVINQVGTYKVDANFYGLIPYKPSSAESTIQIEEENAILTYIGDTLVRFGSLTNLSCNVSEETDGSPGDITMAGPVTFEVYKESSLYSTYTTNITSQSPGNGTANTSINLPVGVYKIVVKINSQYYTSNPSSEVLLAVYDPSGGFATGGGWLIPAGSSHKTNFGFEVKYKSDGSIKGNFEIIDHNTGNTYKETSLSWLVIDGNKAYIYGNLSTNGQGSYPFFAQMIDNGTPGSNKDLFYVNIITGGEPVIFAKIIAGGNIKVHK